jgi:SAM-dependent methyltransferase
MIILNLGCGTKTSAHPDVVNIDRSFYLRIRRNPVLRLLAPLALRGERYQRYRSIPDNVVLHDLRRGIPYGESTVDVVYHSHLLEHLDRGAAGLFLTEVRRVLRPGGIQRIVVPDLEQACNAYLSHLHRCLEDGREDARHDGYVAGIIEQCVRREAFSTGRQPPLRRLIEHLVAGDARRRGEVHQWMYDRVNLGALLKGTGFSAVVVQTFRSSMIPGWDSFGLDADENGNERQPGSLLMEARK